MQTPMQTGRSIGSPSTRHSSVDSARRAGLRADRPTVRHGGVCPHDRLHVHARCLHRCLHGSLVSVCTMSATEPCPSRVCTHPPSIGVQMQTRRLRSFTSSRTAVRAGVHRKFGVLHPPNPRPAFPSSYKHETPVTRDTLSDLRRPRLSSLGPADRRPTAALNVGGRWPAFGSSWTTPRRSWPRPGWSATNRGRVSIAIAG